MANSISAGSSRRAIAARAANAAQQRCAVYFPRLLLDFWLAAHAWLVCGRRHLKSCAQFFSETRDRAAAGGWQGEQLKNQHEPNMTSQC
eukprot:COSAG06_NODE_36203_length_450_cov_0.900285_1_plen_88_part_10